MIICVSSKSGCWSTAISVVHWLQSDLVQAAQDAQSYMLSGVESRVRAQNERPSVRLQVAQQVYHSRGRVRHQWSLQFHTSLTRSGQIDHVFAAHCTLVGEHVEFFVF